MSYDRDIMTDLYKAVLSIAPDYSHESKELLMTVVYHCRQSRIKPKSLYFSLKEAPVDSDAHQLYLSMQECPDTLGDLLEKAQKTIEYLGAMPKTKIEAMPKKGKIENMVERISRRSSRRRMRNEVLIIITVIIGSSTILTIINNDFIQHPMDGLINLLNKGIEYRRR